MSEIVGSKIARGAACLAVVTALAGLALENRASAQEAPTNPREGDLLVTTACDQSGQGFLLIDTTSNGSIRVQDKDGLDAVVGFKPAGEQAFKVHDSVFDASFFDLNGNLIDNDGGIVVDCKGTSSTTSSTSVSTSTSTTRPPSTTSTTEATTTTSPTTTAPITTPPTSIQPTTPNAKTGDGYYLFGSDGNVLSFDATPVPRGASNQDIVDGDITPASNSAQLLSDDGTVLITSGQRLVPGSQRREAINPAVGIDAVSEEGSHVVRANGRVDSNGPNTEQLPDLDGVVLNKPIVGFAKNSAPAGEGYWQVAEDGGVFALDGAPFYGSTGNIELAAPVVGIQPTPTGKGYWLVAKDGGIFAYGDAQFYGSTGGVRLAAPVSGMAGTATGNGYHIVAEDSGVFAFGDAQFKGNVVNTGTYGNASVYGRKIVAIVSAAKDS